MEDFCLVEADFQQYYKLDLDFYYKNKIAKGEGFWRYARLFSELPAESRIITKISPAESWTWDNEAQSRILQQIESTNALLYNTNKKKGAKAVKPNDQFQPGYVKKAKDDYQKYLKEKQGQDVGQEIKDFWESRTGVKMV